MSLPELNINSICAMPHSGWRDLTVVEGGKKSAFAIRSRNGLRDILQRSTPLLAGLKPTPEKMGFLADDILSNAEYIMRTAIEGTTAGKAKKDCLIRNIIGPLRKLDNLVKFNKISATGILSSYQNWHSRPHITGFSDYFNLHREFFFEPITPFHLEAVRIVADFEKKRTSFENQLNRCSCQEEINIVEGKYRKTRRIAYIKIINLCISTLGPIFPVSKKKQFIQDKILMFHLQKETKPSTLGIIDYIDKSIKGGESIKELDLIALKINTRYHNLTVSDVLKEYAVYGISSQEKNYLQQFGDLKLTDLHHRLQKKTRSKNGAEDKLDAVAFKLFKQKDIYGPLIEGISKLFQDVPLSKAQSLIYLLYQIDNVFMEPSEEAVEITRKALSLYKKSVGANYKPIENRTLTKVSEMIDQFALTKRKWKSAWSYFGSEQAGEILQLLLDSHYGPLFFRDLVDFAKNEKIIAPAQILGITRQFNIENLNLSYTEILQKLYDSGETLISFTKKHGITYQVTGLNRAHEYSQKKKGERITTLEKLITEEYRHGTMLSLGGGVATIEAIRAKLLGWSGKIVSVDHLSFNDLLERTLVFENEFRYRSGNPCLTPKEIRHLLKDSPRPIVYIQEPLPINEEVLAKKHKVILEGPLTVFDQRTLMYLSKEKFLESIGSSLKLIANNKGGIYFLTKGWADKLFVDLAFKIIIDEDGKAKVSLEFLHHTNSFYSSEKTIINGTYKPGDSVLFAEGGTRYKRGKGTEFVSVGFQDGRRSKLLDDQQKARTVDAVAQDFLRTHIHLMQDMTYSGVSYPYYLAVAYSLTKNLPLFIPKDLKKDEIPIYLTMMEALGQIIKSFEEEPLILSSLAVNIIKSLNGLSVPINSFFLNGLRYGLYNLLNEIKKNPDILREPIFYLKNAFSSSHQIAIIPPENLFRLNYRKPKNMAGEIYAEQQSQNILSRFIDEFRYEFANFPGEFNVAPIIADVIFDLLGLPKITKNLKKDDLIIIMEIRKKIEMLNEGKRYRMNFSNLSHPQERGYTLKILERINDNYELWERVLCFIEQLEVRTMQRTM